MGGLIAGVLGLGTYALVLIGASYLTTNPAVDGASKRYMIGAAGTAAGIYLATKYPIYGAGVAAGAAAAGFGTDLTLKLASMLPAPKTTVTATAATTATTPAPVTATAAAPPPATTSGLGAVYGNDLAGIMQAMGTQMGPMHGLGGFSQVGATAYPGNPMGAVYGNDLSGMGAVYGNDLSGMGDLTTTPPWMMSTPFGAG